MVLVSVNVVVFHKNLTRDHSATKYDGRYDYQHGYSDS